MTAGRLLGHLLAGAWRESVPPLELMPEELEILSPLLLDGGAAGLAWRRLRQTPLAAAGAARRFRDVYRSNALRAALDQPTVVQVLTALRAAGIEPLFAKGWAVARLYSDPGMRPFGDIDLCVRPEQHAAAEEALQAARLSCFMVDLHRGVERGGEAASHRAFGLLDDRSMDDLYARSELVPLGETEARVLGPEDHLRLLCMHTLGHGAWRPLWLCDIAVALEARPAGFDWDRCLGGDRRRSDWVACALGLAHQLLGARIDDTPVADRARRLPRWLVPTVLRQWGRGNIYRVPISYCLRHPIALLKQLPRHWPNGIEGTVDVRGPFNSWPRQPFQFAAGVMRTAQFLTELPKR